MLTGSYPFVHGARDNGIFVLADRNVTLAEIFKGAGYTTRAEVAALVLKRECGLNQGFDTYGDVRPQKSVSPFMLGQEAALERALAGNREPTVEPEPPELEVERKAEEITNKAIEWLDTFVADDEPFFMFLHYFDPHWPHEAPQRFRARYKDGYLAEIAYFDEQFGRLIDAVRERGLAEDTLVVLTSDHGEGRGQHGEMTHSTFLYDTTLHVPLILWCPGQVPAGQVVETQVRTVDIAPTIVDFARLERTPQMQGESLLPLLVDPDRPSRRPCYSDTIVPKTTYGYSPLRSLRVDGWKYILAPRPELYHVAEDRLELFNLAASQPEQAAAMKAELRQIVASSPRLGTMASLHSLDPDELQRMAALGYVSSELSEDDPLLTQDELASFEPTGINPRDRIEVVECWAAGLGALRVGDWKSAERIFRRFIELEPDNPVGPSYLARALMMLDRQDEAIVMFRRATELNPKGVFEYRQIGGLLAAKGQLDEAVEAYHEALAINPEDYPSLLNLGKTLIAMRRYEEAAETLRQAVQVRPAEPAGHMWRGVALDMFGRSQEALTEMEETVRLASNSQLAYDNLAVVLVRMGRGEEAIRRLQEALESMPNAPLLHHRLAEIYTRRGEHERATEHFVQVVEILPDSPAAQQNLGANLVARGKGREALPHLRRAVELEPNFVKALMYLARALEQVGQLEQAWETYQQVMGLAPREATVYIAAANLLDEMDDPGAAIDVLSCGREQLPDDPRILNDLAWRLATCRDADVRDSEQAVQLAEYACALTGAENASALDTLAAAYAAAGRFDEAVTAAQHALALARELEQSDLAASIAERLALYERRQPYLESPASLREQ